MDRFINTLEQYVRNVVGEPAIIRALTEEELKTVPMYLKGLFTLWRMDLYGKTLVLVHVPADAPITAGAIKKQFEKLRATFGSEPVLAADWLPSATRIRLAQKRINFIIPGRQIFLPVLFIDQRENKSTVAPVKAKLRPATQALFIYCLRHRNELFNLSFLKLAAVLGYSPMAISLAAKELGQHELMMVRRRGRTIHLDFSDSHRQLWWRAQPFMTDPVINRLYTDNIPRDCILYKANIPALSEYTAIDAGRQEYFAIGRKAFRESRMQEMLVNPNTVEGTYCLEIWKYDPGVLTQYHRQQGVVDPLSLYLSLRNTNDERLEVELNHLIERLL